MTANARLISGIGRFTFYFILNPARKAGLFHARNYAAGSRFVRGATVRGPAIAWARPEQEQMITEQQAIELAKQAASERGVEWLEHTNVRPSRPLFKKQVRRWLIYSTTGYRDSAEVGVLLNAETGEVLDFWAYSGYPM